MRNPHAEQRSMHLPGHKVRYWFYDVDSRRKPLLVMVHGFRGDHHGLQLIAHALRERYHVVVPDLPGFGRSEPFPDDSPHDVAHYVRFLQRFITELTDGAVDDDAEHGVAVLGHSFGSVIAAHFAAEHPRMVSRLVLVNPISEPALEGSRQGASRIADLYYTLGASALPGWLGSRLLRSSAITDLVTREMATTRDPEVLDYITHQHRAYFSTFATRQVIKEAYAASVSRTVAEVAPQLTMPVLLLVGGKDPLGSAESQRRMASWIRRHASHEFPDTGHLIHYEQPERSAELIDGFLAGPAPAPRALPDEQGPHGAEVLHDQLPSTDLAAPNTEQFTRVLPVIGRRQGPR